MILCRQHFRISFSLTVETGRGINCRRGGLTEDGDVGGVECIWAAVVKAWILVADWWIRLVSPGFNQLETGRIRGRGVQRDRLSFVTCLINVTPGPPPFNPRPPCYSAIFWHSRFMNILNGPSKMDQQGSGKEGFWQKISSVSTQSVTKFVA